MCCYWAATGGGWARPRPVAGTIVTIRGRRRLKTSTFTACSDFKSRLAHGLQRRILSQCGARIPIAYFSGVVAGRALAAMAPRPRPAGRKCFAVPELDVTQSASPVGGVLEAALCAAHRERASFRYRATDTCGAPSGRAPAWTSGRLLVEQPMISMRILRLDSVPGLIAGER